MSKHKQWYVRTNTKTFGPFSSVQLRQLAKDGKVRPDHEVSLDQTNWALASTVRGLHFQSGHSSAASPKAESRTSFQPTTDQYQKLIQHAIFALHTRISLISSISWALLTIIMAPRWYGLVPARFTFTVYYLLFTSVAVAIAGGIFDLSRYLLRKPRGRKPRIWYNSFYMSAVTNIGGACFNGVTLLIILAKLSRGRFFIEADFLAHRSFAFEAGLLACWQLLLAFNAVSNHRRLLEEEKGLKETWPNVRNLVDSCTQIIASAITPFRNKSPLGSVTGYDARRVRARFLIARSALLIIALPTWWPRRTMLVWIVKRGDGCVRFSNRGENISVGRVSTTTDTITVSLDEKGARALKEWDDGSATSFEELELARSYEEFRCSAMKLTSTKASQTAG